MGTILQDAPALAAAAGGGDPDRVRQYFRELEDRQPAFFAALAPHPERLRSLAAVFSLSRFLGEELLRNPEWILDLGDLRAVRTPAEYRDNLTAFLRTSSPANESDLSLRFALFRRRELLRILIRDGHGAPVTEITEEISSLAEAILDRAVCEVLERAEERHGRPIAAGGPARFSVIGLGKLGGRELNYSSDIDLLFLYSGAGETDGPHPVTNKEFFNKAANQITNLLSTYTPAGLCYRVDLRLRPDGRLGEVSSSLPGAKDYYSKRARDWELQMLVKARVVAGDPRPANELLEFVRPLIYSTTLDFSMIETMSATRERLSEKLAKKRLKHDQLDIKLAPGGIRDIEFLAQCLQRLHGARDSTVQHTGTLFALSSLLDGDLLSPTEHTQLANAYIFLRTVEHRLQFEDDRQTHTLPSDSMEFEKLARRMPQPMSAAELLSTLNRHLENVHIVYDRIVHAQRPLSYSAPLAALPAASPPAEARTALDDFLSSAPAKQIQIGPGAADYGATLFKLSPYLGEQLSRNPDLMAEVERVAVTPDVRPAFEGRAARLNDVDGLGRFYAQEMFRILTASVCVPEPVFKTLDRASGLTEFFIARAYRIALEQALAHARAHATDARPFTDPELQMMVVALGRLGMREFDLGSDADLVFVIPDVESPRQQFWTRVAERMIEIVSAYRGAGSVLSLDTRLRPNGREGMLVQTESAYVDFFSGKAEAWQGMAYMKARGVAGDLERATTFLSNLQQVDWRRYGQSGRSRQDLHQMRLRLEREQGAAAPLKAGRGGYYDADFLLMYLRLKGAGLFFKSLNTPERIDIVEKMGHLDRDDAALLLRATTFFRAVDHACRLVFGRAESKLPGPGPERARVAQLVQRWTGEAASGETLPDQLAHLQDRVRRLFETTFG